MTDRPRARSAEPIATNANPILGMTAARWERLPETERARLRDTSWLLPQLTGLEGWRVEVVDHDGQRRRFIVGRSTGWRPIHLEIKTRRSLGGWGADSRGYLSVRKLYRVRG